MLIYTQDSGNYSLKLEKTVDKTFMKYKGGYNIRLSNPPTGNVLALPTPEQLFLTRHIADIYFDELMVSPDEKVDQGQALARCNKGPLNMHAPMAGTVKYITDNQIILGQLNSNTAPTKVTPGSTQDTIFSSGCFIHINEVYSGKIPAKDSIPQAIFVRIANLDNYVMASEIELMGSLQEFCSGLKLLADISKDTILHVVVTKKQAVLAKKIKNDTADISNIELVTIPPRYGLDNTRLIADRWGYRADQHIWSISPQGIFALARAVNQGEKTTYTYMSVSGPAVNRPQYYKVPLGYPIADLLKASEVKDCPVRVINGGVMSGIELAADQTGVTGDIAGLTVLENNSARKLLKFARFGLDDRRFEDFFTTDMQGEVRACVSCGYCQSVCPAGLLPDYLHKLLYCNDLDRAQSAGLNKCVHCGLCSFICVSKIELTEQFIKGQAQLKAEQHKSSEGQA
ncbi:MAG: 4Fe-4S dicluster domain-containing protein [Sedimentisphaerales bacterium]|nr:4Fe-4S dicluster domain-containing protein [Sedimentisphaerales bacterium]MBN2842534.1 4Fe-4S dicluster domain-containing protein [Sedimentisphaerales bacterium]